MIGGEGAEPVGLVSGDAGVGICTAKGVVEPGPVDWGGVGVFNEDEARGVWVGNGREGLSDGCVMVYRAA